MRMLFYHVRGIFSCAGIIVSDRHSGKLRTALFNIPLNEEGIPIPPHVEVLETSIAQLATLLDEYLLSLWSKYSDVVVRKCLKLKIF
jgi:hypothetical protein